MDLNMIMDESCVVKASWGTTPEGGKPKEDKVMVQGEISFEGLTLEEVLKWASKPVIILRQKDERVMEEIPTEAKIKADKPGRKRKVKDPKKIVEKLSSDEAKVMLEALKERLKLG